MPDVALRRDAPPAFDSGAGRERPPRPLPALPHADGRRVRRRLRVPQLRRLVRGGPRPCPARLGGGRRGDGGSGGHGASLPRGAGGRARTRSRSSRTRSRAGCHGVRSCSAAAAARTSARSAGSPAATSASPSSGSTRTVTSTRRRARRRGTSGACRSGWRSTRAASDAANVALVGARDLDPPERGVRRRARDRRRPRPRARRRRRRLRRARRRRARAGGLPVLHAGRRAGSAWTRSRRSCARGRELRHASPGSGSPVSRRAPTPRPSRDSRPRPGSDGTGTKMPGMSAPGNIDVSIEHKRADPSARDGSGGHPNTCPGCGSHYRDDELAEHLRVCPQCGHHFPVRAPERVEQLADAGSFEEEDGDLRSADPLEFFDLRPYVERLAEAELGTGLGDAILTGRASIDGHPCRLAAMDFSFMGGSMGSVVGERFARACERAAEDGGAARLRLGLGRRADAGGDPGADAAAEDGGRRRRPPRRGRRAALGARAPDHGRRHGELREPRRRDPRRAGRADVVRRPARRRADDPREAAGRLRPRRVELPLRPRRRGRAARRSCARRSRGSSASSGRRR